MGGGGGAEHQLMAMAVQWHQFAGSVLSLAPQAPELSNREEGDKGREKRGS